MDYKATLMVLVLVSSTLAGCTGDPDGGGGDEIDSDALQDLFDEHFQDFLNNTTITVVNNYHNNTTYVVDDGDYSSSSSTNVGYNNTTNVDGGEIINNYNEYDSSNTSYNFGGASFGNGVNGTVSGGNMMFVAHVTFSAMDLFPDFEEEDYRNNSFNYSHYYYDYLTNSYRWDDFTFSCQVFYLIGSLSNGSTFQVSYWEDSNNYWEAWDNEYNSTIADMLVSAGANDSNVRSTCDEGYAATMPIKDGTDGWQYNFLSIDIPQGYAIEYIQLASEHSFHGCTNWLTSGSCIDSSNHHWTSVSTFYNYSEGVHPGNENWYYGGWDNITIDFDMMFNSCDDAEGSYDSSYCRWSPAQNPYGPDDYSSAYWGVADGSYSMWPTSAYEFTLYYQFVPVMPVE
jgi:hypothetical protein